MKVEDETSSNPLEEFRADFKREVNTLHRLLLLRTNREDEKVRQEMYPLFKASADMSAEIEKATAGLMRYVAEERAQLARFREFQRLAARQQKRIALMRAQIPAEILDCLSLDAHSDNENEPVKAATVTEKAVPPPQEEEKKPVKPSEPVETKPPQPTKQPKPSASAPAKKQKKEQKGGARGVIPVICSVSEAELAAAPQYVKGRLTCVKIDNVVEKLNAIAASKYELLAKPYRDLNSNEITNVQDFQANDCDETKGKQYLTDSEIKGFGAFRLDATAKSVINVLRHVGSLKEVRGKNRARIFIINSDRLDE